MTDGEKGPDRMKEYQDWLLQVYRTTFEQAHDAVLIQDFEGVVYCNSALLALLRVPDGATCKDLTVVNTSAPYQDDGQPVSEAATAKLEEALTQGRAFFEWRSRTWDGVEFPSEVHLSRIDLKERQLVMAVVRDISERKAHEEALKKYRAAFEQSRDAIMFLDRQRFLDCNTATLTLFRVPDCEHFREYHPADLSPPRQANGRPSAEAANERIEEAFAQGQAFYEWRHQTADGQAFPAEVLISRIDLGDGAVLQAVVRDVTEQRELEAQLAHQASHDPLTGLLNRRSFREALKREIARAERYGQTFALIMMDIDHFKAINDTYGHEVGDRTLEELGALMSERVRETDLLARWGGEEFMALLPATGLAGARELAEAIRCQVGDQGFPGRGHLTISLGVVEYRAYEEIKDVTKRVDVALYAAKEGGRNRVVVEGENPGAGKPDAFAR